MNKLSLKLKTHENLSPLIPFCGSRNFCWHSNKGVIIDDFKFKKHFYDFLLQELKGALTLF